MYSYGRSLSSNNEAEYYADPSVGPNPFSVQNGALTITARPTQPGEQTGGLPYTSGMITTENSFSQNQGYFEIRAQTPGNQGFWAAFWMLPVGGAGNPELDVLEQPNNGGSSSYWSYVNFGDQDKGGGFVDTGTTLSAGYHAYGMMWTGTAITFYFDGQQVGATRAPPANYGSKMFMLANLAVGGAGSWPGQPVGTPTAQYKIDHIRAYSLDPSVPAVALQTLSSPDGVDTRPSIAVPPPPPRPPIGSGVDTLTLNMAEDAWQGDAQFTIAIDGVLQGGTQTVTASKTAGQVEPILIKGNFGTSQHTVTINFLNDAYGGSAQTDRNLYVLNALLNGVALPNSAVTALGGGPQSFRFTGSGGAATPPPVTPPPVTVTAPSGTRNVLTLQMAEDAWQGDARFTISVDGVQQGGVQTTTALNSANQTQAFIVNGNFAAGLHTVTVNFTNDAWGGTALTDRNLYVKSATLDGVAIPGSSLVQSSGGAKSFDFRMEALPPVTSFPTVVVGSGPDTILIGLNEDAYNGDALFTLSVDGRQLGGTLSTQASHAAGQTQLFALKGTFGSGTHRVAVNFLNDAWGGTAQTDRNLYVSSLSYNGVESPTNSAALLGSGTVTLGVGSGAAQDSITFLLTEDAYQGNAQVALSLDGKLLGTPTITFLNSGGVAEAFTYTGDFGGKGVTHTATVDFLNDAWGGTATTDRNVYVKSIVFDGVARPELATALLGGGAVNFILPAS